MGMELTHPVRYMIYLVVAIWAIAMRRDKTGMNMSQLLRRKFKRLSVWICMKDDPTLASGGSHSTGT